MTPSTYNIRDARTGDLWTVWFFTSKDNPHSAELQAEIYRNGIIMNTWKAGYGQPSSLKAAWIVRKILNAFYACAP